MTYYDVELAAHDLRFLQALRALPDNSLDRARAHLAAGLPLRRADLGWRGGGPANDGCLVGVSMSRLSFFRAPLRIPALILLAAVFDSWSFEEIRRHGQPAELRSRHLPRWARDRLGLLLDVESRRRQGWAPSLPPTRDEEMATSRSDTV
jgi:hypothetical protein